MALIYFYNSSKCFVLLFYNSFFNFFTLSIRSGPYLLLIPSFNVWFTGGLMAFGSTAGLFITSHSEEASRGVRFVALEIFIILGYSGSMFLGGRLLRNRETPTADQPQLRTYYYNFLLMLVFDLASTALLFALYQVMKKKKKASSGCKMVVQSTKESTEIAVVSTNSSTSSATSNNNKTALQVFFNLDNARQTLAAFFRKRPQNVRMQIFLLVFIEFSQLVLTSGLDGLMITFSQSVYHWSSETFSTVQAVNQIVSMGLLAVFSALFITWLGLADSTLILLAQISNFACDLIRGTFLSPLAYFIAIPVGSLTGFGIVCTKAKFSKIIPPGEAGKIFSLNATFEAFVPLGASFIYSYLFTFSFSTYPGLIYHFSCLIMIFTVGALILERRFCPVTGQENAGAEEEEEKVDKVDLESAERLPPKNVL